MTPAEAKKIVIDAIEKQGLQHSYDRLTAKTVGFSDLGRGSRLFVKVHGLQPNPAWAQVEMVARLNGFSIE